MLGTVSRTGFVLLVVALTSVSEAAAQIMTAVGDPVHGERLFKDKACARCHGVRAGGTPNAPALGKVARQRSPLELAATIWNHSPEMSAKARELGIRRPALTATETGDVLAFLYSLSFVDDPGNPKRGLALLKQKQCLVCHSNGGAKPTDAPDLKQLVDFASAPAMLHAMWVHAADMQEEMRAQQIRRVTFAGTDMADIVAYLQSIGGRKENAPISGDAREGAKLFAVKGCTRCHSINRYGGHVGQDLGSHKLPRTPSGMAGLLWNHGSRMRQLMDRYAVPLPKFTRDELLDVVAYLYFLGFDDPPGDPLKGRALFSARGCGRCHGTGADTRTRTGPDLSQSQAVLSSLEAARLMWEHAPKMEARLTQLGIKWPEFARGELADLIAYINSLQTTSLR